jgi:membrane protease YdiL (CAAX protease family)
MQQEDGVISVPWSGFDVLLMFVLWFGLMIFCTDVTKRIFAVEEVALAPVEVKQTTDHPLTQMVKKGGNVPVIVLVALLSAVISAPLVEELLFRLLLQGWLAAKISVRWSADWLSILIVSILFAAAHYGGRTEHESSVLFAALLGLAVANFSFLLFGWGYFVWVRKIPMLEHLFDTNRTLSDLGFAAGLFILFAPFTFLLHGLIRAWFPEAVTDPIPLFFFSLLLGTLYAGTRRVFPCVILHACLNGFSLLCLLLANLISGT